VGCVATVSPTHQNQADWLERRMLKDIEAYLFYTYLCSSQKPAPSCEHCECKCVLTVEHVLFICTTYEHSKESILLQLTTFRHMLLYSPICNIFDYLTDIILFSKTIISL